MKQTIEIEVPDGKKAVLKDNQVIFEDIKPKLPKTWEEFCNIKEITKSETYINSNSECAEIKESSNIIRRYYRDKNYLPSKKAAEQHLALMQLHQLRDCYRQGWIPDWDDEKFIITVNYKEFYSVGKCIKTKEFLAFQSREIAEEFLTNFQDLIKQAGDLI